MTLYVCAIAVRQNFTSARGGKLKCRNRREKSKRKNNRHIDRSMQYIIGVSYGCGAHDRALQLRAERRVHDTDNVIVIITTEAAALKSFPSWHTHNLQALHDRDVST